MSCSSLRRVVKKEREEIRRRERERKKKTKNKWKQACRGTVRGKLEMEGVRCWFGLALSRVRVRDEVRNGRGPGVPPGRGEEGARREARRSEDAVDVMLCCDVLCCHDGSVGGGGSFSDGRGGLRVVSMCCSLSVCRRREVRRKTEGRGGGRGGGSSVRKMGTGGSCQYGLGTVW